MCEILPHLRVFEDDHARGIETYGSMVFSSMKQILNDVHDADVSVVTLFVNSEATLWSVSSMRSSKMIKCFSLRSRVSKSGNPC